MLQVNRCNRFNDNIGGNVLTDVSDLSKEQVEKSFETFKNLNFVDKKGNKLNISEQVRQILGSYSYLTHDEISKHTGWSIDQINQLEP